MQTVFSQARWLLYGMALTGLAAEQPSKPPQNQLWIDVSTSASNMPGMAGMPGGGMLGGLFGGKGKANTFGNTRMSMGAGRWMDVTLLSRANPSLQEATQQVPDGSKLAPSLKLISAEGQVTPLPSKPAKEDEPEPAPEMHKPKGKMILYWGCGAEVRKGQPRVLDMATAQPGDMVKFFESRRATSKGAHSTPGQPVWPNKEDNRALPEGASLVGEHVVTGEGLPAGFKFSIDQAHDIMPAIALTQRDDGNAKVAEWQPVTGARAYFLASMGPRDEGEMVIWTSSELPDMGFGLLDYQPNASVDRWLKDKVLLPPQATQCAIPKEALGKGGMLRMIAFGDELNLAYPPRPKDLKQVWEPQWAVKLRLKSVATAMLGMPGMGRMDSDGKPVKDNGEATDKPAAPTPLNLLKGLFGR